MVVGKKLELEPVLEKDVNDSLMKVAEAKREANLFMVTTKFGEKKRINEMKVDSARPKKRSKGTK